MDQGIKEADEKKNETFFWSPNSTKSLIDLFKKYRSKVGTMKMKNFKAMWEVIAKELSELLHEEISAKNCENRWKVLDRNYKKWVDNKNSTGRGRKHFEFSEEMDEIYGKKRSVNPILLLGSQSHVPIDVMGKDEEVQEEVRAEPPLLLNPSTSSNNADKGEVLRRKSVKKRKTVLEQMREDRLQYQEKKLQFLERAHEEAMSVMRERNEILKKKNCNCTTE